MLTYRVCPVELPVARGWKRAVGQVLGALLPNNDPDFQFKSGPVAYWWLELEGSEGRREIGFGPNGEVARFAPVGDNWGVFVGEDVAPTHLSEHVTAEAFEEAWGRALAGWAH